MSAPLKIQQLRQFVIAARNQSFRVAALETHRSQAAITLAMRALQEKPAASCSRTAIRRA